MSDILRRTKISKSEEWLDGKSVAGQVRAQTPAVVNLTVNFSSTSRRSKFKGEECTQEP